LYFILCQIQYMESDFAGKEVKITVKNS